MLIDIEVALAATGSLTPAVVRLWLDLNPEGGLETEVEVRLQQSRSTRWTGCFSAPRGLESSYFLYRLAVHAPLRTEWSLSLRERDSGREVLSDADLVAMPKTWVVGTCSLAPVAASAMESGLVSLPTQSPARAPLMLAHPLPLKLHRH